MQEEQARKQREKYKLEKTKQKATKAYQEQEILVEIRKQQNVEEEKTRKTFLDMAKELVLRVFHKPKEESQKEDEIKRGITHKEFSKIIETSSNVTNQGKWEIKKQKMEEVDKEEQR